MGYNRIKKKYFLLVLTIPIVIAVPFLLAYAEDISNQSGSVTCGVSTCVYTVGPNVSVEDFNFELEDVLVRPSFGNEIRKIKFEIEDIDTTDLTVTLTVINELVIIIDAVPDQSAPKMKFEIEGSIVDDIQLNDVSQAFTFNPQGAGSSSIETEELPFDTIKIFLPQNVDTNFATHGRNLEGSFLNTLTFQQQERFWNLMELYNPSPAALEEIIIDLNTNKKRANEVIGKMNVGGFYNTSQAITNASITYRNHYDNSVSIEDFFDDLRQEVNNSLPPDGLDPEDGTP